MSTAPITLFDHRGQPIQRSLENPQLSLDSEEAFEFLGGKASASGVRITRDVALTHGPVWRAVNLIAGDVAKLPLFIYRRVDAGKERASEHPAYRLLRYKPNDAMTAFVFRQTIQAHVLLEGNGYAYIMRSGAGVPMELLPLSPERTYAVRENGRLWYVHELAGGTMRKLAPEDVIHIRGLGFDGLTGYSVVQKARESIGAGIAEAEYGARFFRNNARPNMILEHPQKLSTEAARRLKESWEKMHSGLENAHRTAVLEEGMKANALTINARDAQLLESRQFNLRDVANWFGVPPHKLGDTTRTAYASLEQENQSYLDESLDRWLVLWEEECRDKLLTEEEKGDDSHVVEFLRQALVRADLTARANYYGKALAGAPWMLVNQVRAAENMNAIDGGDALIIPANIQPPPAENSAARAALCRLIRDALARMVRRIGIQAQKESKRRSDFDAWLTGCEEANRGVFLDAAGPGIEAFEAMFGASESRAVPALATRFFAAIRSAMIETAGQAGEFPNQIAHLCGRLEATLPQRLIDDLYSENRHDSSAN